MKNKQGNEVFNSRGKRRFFAAAVMCMLLALSIAAFADYVDLSKKGSISLTLQYKLKDKSGKEEVKKLQNGTMSIYKVAEAVEKEDVGQIFDISKGKFASVAAVKGIPDMTTAQLEAKNRDLSKALVQAISEKKIAADKSADISDGKVKFDNLVPGLYLICQSKNSTGSAKETITFTPYLQSVPDKDGKFDITGTPKPEIEAKLPKETETEPHTQPHTQTETTPHTKPPETNPSKLPQTGQLWWPVPVLGLAGILLLAVGFWRRKKSQE